MAPKAEDIRARFEALQEESKELAQRHRKENEYIDGRLRILQASCPHQNERSGLFGIRDCADCGKNLNNKSRLELKREDD